MSKTYIYMRVRAHIANLRKFHAAIAVTHIAAAAMPANAAKVTATAIATSILILRLNSVDAKVSNSIIADAFSLVGSM